MNWDCIVMDEKVFREFLKKSGRQSNVIEKYVLFVIQFEDYLAIQTQGKEELTFTTESLVNYISDYESTTKKSTRTILYALIQYFKATKNDLMYKIALELRETRKVKKAPFLLKKILGIESKYIEQLSTLGIKNVNDMITAGRSPKRRRVLVEKTDIPYDVIVELVKISDLTRVGYVKEKLTRLYFNAGVQTPADLSEWDAAALHNHFEQYIKNSGWDGMVPYLSDLRSNIANAKKLKSIVEYE
ncbi:hypothetical protein CEE45_13700 [Candidatus Heimdallarchaeota archaeon B3_Heim]|nr:MAG: hypothetical protein CEE45_13700 [Candidatus Heimdallarchaeota archaeon B3_Heim]